ncbi:MAG: hypothetical protein MJ220_01875 [Bacilli bacterium]|nr:hypothetical protein [Bacilli bacterium]
MSERFNEFKKKMTIEVLVKALLIGLSVGFLASGGAILTLKLIGIALHPLYIALIVAGGLALGAGVFSAIFFPLKPSDLKVAKRLDEELGLNEKMQTMVIFKDSDAPVMQLQREDAVSVLSTKPTKSVKFRFSLVVLAAFIVTGAVFTTSHVVPVIDHTVQHQTPTDPPYILDSWTEQAIMDLIKYINSSEAQPPAKEQLVGNLEALLKNLKVDGVTIPQMQEYVENTIYMNTSSINRVNVGDDIALALSTADEKAILHISSAMLKADKNGLEKAILELKDILDSDGFMVMAPRIHKQMGQAMEAAGIDKTETDIARQLYRLSNLIDFTAKNESRYATFMASIEPVLNEASRRVPEAIIEEKVNIAVKDYVNDRLVKIFQINPPEQQGPQSGGHNNETGNNDVGDHTGGMGTGELIMGSDDVILDYEEGYVQYKDVISKYLADLLALYEDGTLPEEYKDLIDYYYGLLYGSIKADEEGEETGTPGSDGDGTGV